MRLPRRTALSHPHRRSAAINATNHRFNRSSNSPTATVMARRDPSGCNVFAPRTLGQIPQSTRAAANADAVPTTSPSLAKLEHHGPIPSGTNGPSTVQHVIGCEQSHGLLTRIHNVDEPDQTQRVTHAYLTVVQRAQRKSLHERLNNRSRFVRGWRQVSLSSYWEKDHSRLVYLRRSPNR